MPETPSESPDPAPGGRPGHPPSTRIRDSADRAADGTLGTGERTSPGAGDPIREVGVGLCLKEHDASEPEKCQLWDPDVSLSLRHSPIYGDQKATLAPAPTLLGPGAWADLSCLTPFPQTPLD